MTSLNIRGFSMESSDGHRYNLKVDSKLWGDSWIFFRLMFHCLFVVSPTILHDLSPNFASLTLPLPFPSCQTINTINTELHQAFKHYGFVPQTFNFNASSLPALYPPSKHICFPKWKLTCTYMKIWNHMCRINCVQTIFPLLGQQFCEQTRANGQYTCFNTGNSCCDSCGLRSAWKCIKCWFWV